MVSRAYSDRQFGGRTVRARQVSNAGDWSFDLPRRRRRLQLAGVRSFDLSCGTPAALADFDRAIVLAPKYASACLGRAFALEQPGNQQTAAVDLAKATKLDPKLVAAVRAPQTASLVDSTAR